MENQNCLYIFRIKSCSFARTTPNINCGRLELDKYTIHILTIHVQCAYIPTANRL